MKYIILSIFIILLSCGRKYNYTSEQKKDYTNRYVISKIDSINTYYIIYGKMNNSWYKIISKKTINKNCNNIVIGQAYQIELNSILLVNGKSIIPVNQINEISGWRIDNVTTINFEGDSIRNIYMSKDLDGLCLKNR